MKYLSKEELERITNRLLENPTKEELKKLAEEYSKEVSEVSASGEENKSPVDLSNNNVNKADDIGGIHIPTTEGVKPAPTESLLASTIPVPSEQNVGAAGAAVSPIPSLVSSPPVNSTVVSNGPVQVSPSIFNNVSDQNSGINVVEPKVPSLEIPSYNVPSGAGGVAPVQSNSPLNFNGNLFEQSNNMMQTTDNFGETDNFNLFSQSANPVVSDDEPTMFGQTQNGQ